MDKEKLESLIIDYIDNKLNSVDRHKIEQELIKNPDAYKLYEQLKEVIHVMDKSSRIEPSMKLRSNFQNMLQQEVEEARRSRTIFMNPNFYRIAAAAAFLILAVAIGLWVSERREHERQLAEIKKEMESTKLMMLSMIDNQLSASQRIQGVNVAYKIERADDEVVRALVKRMNEDSNSNVRLAALEALGKFSDDPAVKKALLQSLEVQKDPVVQIALIQMLVKMKEKGVVNTLQKIVDDAETMKAVKDEAYTGIMKLS